MSEFLRVKDRVKYFTLALVERDEYVWHGYKIKKFLTDNFGINKEVIYPTLREMQSKGFLEAKNIYSEESEREQKKFKITKLGIQELQDIKMQIQNFDETLIKIQGKTGFKYE